MNIYHYHEILEYGGGEPAVYASKPITVYQTGTTTPAAIYSDPDLTIPIANSVLNTGEFGDMEFWSPLSSLDVVRQIGGRRTTFNGDPGVDDERRYTRALYLR